MSVKVSVCIPIYGVEKYIERCARSLFEQTMKEGIEFIFVNDCTPDKSVKILKKVLAEYPQRKDQVKIIDHEKNSGLAATRKTGLTHASGEYIIHCDSDDWVELDMYEAMYNKALESNADVVFCGAESNLPNGKKIPKNFVELHSPAELRYYLCADHKYSSMWNKMYRKSVTVLLDLPDFGITMQEDFLQNYYFLKNCKTLAWINKVYYHYFCNACSTSQTKWTQVPYNSVMWILRKIQSDPSEQKLVNTYILNIQQMFLSHPEAVTAAKFRELSQISNFSWSIPMPFLKKTVVFFGRINYSMTAQTLQFLLKLRKFVRNIGV